MNSVTRDWSRGNAASENKARLSFREAQTLRAKLVSTMKQRRTHERIDEKTQHSAWLGVSKPGFWRGPETAARLRLGFGEERRGWAIPRRSSFSIVTSLHLPFCHVQTRRRANCQDTLPWSSVLAGCGGCTSARLLCSLPLLPAWTAWEATSPRCSRKNGGQIERNASQSMRRGWQCGSRS